MIITLFNLIFHDILLTVITAKHTRWNTNNLFLRNPISQLQFPSICYCDYYTMQWFYTGANTQLIIQKQSTFAFNTAAKGVAYREVEQLTTGQELIQIETEWKQIFSLYLNTNIIDELSFEWFHPHIKWGMLRCDNMIHIKNPLHRDVGGGFFFPLTHETSISLREWAKFHTPPLIHLPSLTHVHSMYPLRLDALGGLSLRCSDPLHANPNILNMQLIKTPRLIRIKCECTGIMEVLGAPSVTVTWWT